MFTNILDIFMQLGHILDKIMSSAEDCRMESGKIMRMRDHGVSR